MLRLQSVIIDFWNLTIFNGTGSSKTTSTTQYQNVSRIYLEVCDATFTTEVLNFTAYNEANLTVIDPFDFQGTFDFWLGSGTVKRSNAFSNSSIDEINLCLSPNSITTVLPHSLHSNGSGCCHLSLYSSRIYFKCLTIQHFLEQYLSSDFLAVNISLHITHSLK